ncbi:M23 family metallopeptidase [Microcoleus sp. T3_A4]|uniref:M23 family metallopeptidase n=1 Tax=Microcoleus sp. T3_A4 TaxID=2818968 RepID=UPI002FD020E1
MARTPADTTEMPTKILEIPGMDRQGNPTSVNALLPDWTQISFSQMPPISQSGSLSAGEYKQAVGYDLSRSWTAGQTPDQYIMLGDISQALQPELLSFGFVAQQAGLNLDSVALSAFTLVAKQSLNQLVQAIPLLGQFKVAEIAPVAGLLATKAAGIDVADRTLELVLSSNPQLGQLKLGEIDLSQYSISSIPNLNSAQLGAFSDWQTTLIKDVPGLNALPLSSFPNPIAEFGNLVMRIDAIYGPAERRRTKTISGSDVQGFSVNCQENDCAYIELDDLENSGRNARGSLEGKQWISGKYQEVEGGSGCLKVVNGGKEPTGRLPFGSAFKVVVMEPDERTDTVDTALFFRFCSPCGCSPYFIGPVPFFTYRVNSPIFVGALESSSSGSSSVATGAVRGSVSSPITKGVGTAANINVPCPPSATVPVLVGNVQGVKVAALSEAIANIESSGSYETVGVHVCADGGKNCGVPLGKYQFMSYNEYAASSISSKPEGEQFLAKLQGGYQPTQAELFQFFPPADQEAVFAQTIASKLNATSQEKDPTTGSFFSGDRLIERVAQKHFGGDYSKVDGSSTDTFGRLTLLSYGQDVLKRYRGGSTTVAGSNTAACVPTSSAAQSSNSASVTSGGQSTGIKPANGPVTRRFGMRTRPVSGVRKTYSGIAIAGSMGSPVKAVDGGVVTTVVSNCKERARNCGGGYGNWIEIDRGNGRTTRYAYLREGSVKLKVGDRISQGQVIGELGSTGTTAEPRLHFETRINGTAVNPYQEGI